MSHLGIQHDPEAIVALLRERGWRAVDLARKTGLSQPSIWALLRGVTKMPKASTLVSIANALGVPLKTILKKSAGKQSTEDLQGELIAVFGALDPGNQRAIVAAAKALLSPPKPPKHS